MAASLPQPSQIRRKQEPELRSGYYTLPYDASVAAVIELQTEIDM